MSDQVEECRIGHRTTDVDLVARCDGDVYRGIGLAVNFRQFAADFLANILRCTAVSLDQTNEGYGEKTVGADHEQGHVILLRGLLGIAHDTQGVATLDAYLWRRK